MSSRLAAYAVCIDGDRVLLAHCVSPAGRRNWTLPGGRVELTEDPFDAVLREVAEETGYEAVVERLLGVHTDRGGEHASPLLAGRRRPGAGADEPPTGHVAPVPVGGLVQH